MFFESIKCIAFTILLDAYKGGKERLIYFFNQYRYQGWERLSHFPKIMRFGVIKVLNLDPLF